MYRILNFVNFTWVEHDNDGPYDDLSDAITVAAALKQPWRIQEWIDIRNGPAEAGFWHDVEWWMDGKQHRATTERIT